MPDGERSGGKATPPAAGGTPRVLTLVFTDLVDSTAVKTRLGDWLDRYLGPVGGSAAQGVDG